MKLTTILVAASCLTAQAFGVSPRTFAKNNAVVNSNNSLRKQAPATSSPLFRDAALTRGGAVPGWAAYNEALDKNPLTAKACTSLVGWFLGDLLAQVSLMMRNYVSVHLWNYYMHTIGGCHFSSMSAYFFLE